MSPGKRKRTKPTTPPPANGVMYRCPECQGIAFAREPITGGMTCNWCTVTARKRVEMRMVEP